MDSHTIHTPFQAEFLESFFQNEIGQRFFLTGGTALAAFYIGHRYSEHIDLFTTDTEAMELVQPELNALAERLGATTRLTVATPTLRQLSLSAPGNLSRLIWFGTLTSSLVSTAELMGSLWIRCRISP